jgi:hypothetical protein
MTVPDSRYGGIPNAMRGDESGPAGGDDILQALFTNR